MSNKTLFLGIIIIIVMAAFVAYNPTDVQNKRGDDSDSSTQSTTFVSRLKTTDTSNLETLSEPLTELKSETLMEGSGDETAQNGDRITVNYRGWLASNGEIFDQSFNRGDEGFTFTIGSGVIDGWSIGTVGMKVGEVRRLKIPSSLGYREFGSGDVIPPNADLIFDVELMELN